CDHPFHVVGFGRREPVRPRVTAGEVATAPGRGPLDRLQLVSAGRFRRHVAHPPSTAVDILARCIDVCQYQLMSMKLKRRGCAPVLRGRLGKDDAEELAGAFKAIADPGRLRLLSYIAAQPGAEACVCHLIQPLGLAQPTVSHHLKVLTEAGLLGRERRGTWM